MFSAQMLVSTKLYRIRCRNIVKNDLTLAQESLD